LAAAGRPDDTGLQDCLAEPAGDLSGIVEHDARRIGVRPVHDDLQRRGPSGAQVIPEPLVHPQHCFDQSAIDEMLGLFFPIDVGHHVEVAGPGTNRATSSRLARLLSRSKIAVGMCVTSVVTA
jgi:hypothetical protein